MAGFTIPNEVDAFNPRQAEPDKGDIDVLVAGLKGEGVLSGCAVSAQSPTPSMWVNVDPGKAKIGGVEVNVVGASLQAAAADPTNPRIDLVELAPNGTPSIKAGTPATWPSFPPITSGSILLAAIFIAALDTSVLANRITDKRAILPTPEVVKIPDPNAACLILGKKSKSWNYRSVIGNVKRAFFRDMGPGKPALLTGPQDIDKGATPEFAGVKWGGNFTAFPTHRADIGTVVFDKTNGFFYYNSDGTATGWKPKDFPIGYFGGRMVCNAAATLQLARSHNPAGGYEQFAAGESGYIEINGEMVRAGEQAVSGMDLNALPFFMYFGTIPASMGLIGSDGSPTGNIIVALNNYYIYVSNTRATQPRAMRASLIAPTWNADGVQYLGTTGNAANWRYVGKIRSSASAAFVQNSDTQIYVANYYNRRRYRLFTCPGYNNNNAQTTYTSASATWVEANGGTGSRVEFMTHADQAVLTGLQGLMEGSGSLATAYASVGVNSISQAGDLWLAVVGLIEAIVADSVPVAPAGLVDGYNFLALLIFSSSGTATWYADYGRLGGNSADMRGTYMWADVWA